MRCSQCNKFVSFEEADPEVQSIDISDDGQVTAEVRITNNCAECGDELTEASFSMDQDRSADLEGHLSSKKHELSIDEDSIERTSRSGYFKKGKFIPKGGRYAKTFYGFVLNYTVKCSCGFGIDGTFEDEVQASSMDSLQ